MLVIKFESHLLYHEVRKHFHLFFIYLFINIHVLSFTYKP